MLLFFIFKQTILFMVRLERSRSLVEIQNDRTPAFIPCVIAKPQEKIIVCLFFFSKKLCEWSIFQGVTV